jgi:hypothetical protein
LVDRQMAEPDLEGNEVAAAVEAEVGGRAMIVADRTGHQKRRTVDTTSRISMSMC